MSLESPPVPGGPVCPLTPVCTAGLRVSSPLQRWRWEIREDMSGRRTQASLAAPVRTARSLPGERGSVRPQAHRDQGGGGRGCSSPGAACLPRAGRVLASSTLRSHMLPTGHFV